jgi:hypothetical protein
MPFQSPVVHFAAVNAGYGTHAGFGLSDKNHDDGQ